MRDLQAIHFLKILATSLMLVLTFGLSAAETTADKTKGKSAAPGKPDENELANVAILNFSNNTNSKSYAWLGTSIPNAVHSSMQKRFEYRRPNPEGVQKTTDTLMKQWKVTRLNPQQVRTLAQKTNSHVVVYGSYDLKGDQIRIEAKVFHYDGNRIIGRSVLRSPVDNRLFGSTDKVAEEIVDNIYRFVQQQLMAAKKDDKAQAKPDENKKLAITRKTTTSSGSNNILGIEALGGGVYGGVHYMRKFSLLDLRWHAKIGGIFLPREDFDYFNARIGLGIWFSDFHFEVGPSIYQVSDDNSDPTNVGFAASVGYNWQFMENQYLVPAIYLLYTEERAQPFAGISYNYQF